MLMSTLRLLLEEPMLVFQPCHMLLGLWFLARVLLVLMLPMYLYLVLLLVLLWGMVVLGMVVLVMLVLGILVLDIMASTGEKKSLYE